MDMGGRCSFHRIASNGNFDKRIVECLYSSSRESDVLNSSKFVMSLQFEYCT
jgi:hypothetical protein